MYSSASSGPTSPGFPSRVTSIYAPVDVPSLTTATTMKWLVTTVTTMKCYSSLSCTLCSTRCRGYLSAVEMTSFQQLFDKAKLWNIVASNYDIDLLLENCDRTLFRSYLYIKHCLHICFQINVITRIQLRWDPVAAIIRYLDSSNFMRENHL